MRVVRWRNASTGVESFTITATGIYFPVGKVDSAFIARYAMASAGQTATIERVVSADGTRVGTPGISVSGTTEVVSNDRRGLSTGIIVTSISGTLIPVLDNLSPITTWPDGSLGRFKAMEDLVAYVHGSTPPVGLKATVGTSEVAWTGSAWVSAENVLPTYDTWALAVAAAGSTLGWEGYVKRLCGNGYFRAMHNGVRLGVGCGESVIKDVGIGGAGYLLTASGVSYVSLVSYSVPAGLFAAGEEIELSICDSVTTFVSGTHRGLGRMNGVGMTTYLATLSAAGSRNAGAVFFPTDSTATSINATNGTDLYQCANKALNNLGGLNPSTGFVVDAGVTPGAVGEVSKLLQVSLRRIG